MKRLFWVIILAAAAYSGYWFIGRAGLTHALNTAEPKLPGLTYDSRSTVGFPSRFDTTYTGVNLLLSNGSRYSTPEVQAFALSYAPTKAIGFAPGPHVLTAPNGATLTLTVDDLRASTRVGAAVAPPVEEVIAELKGGTILANETATAALTYGLFAMKQRTPQSYKLHLTLTTLRPLGNYSDLPPIDSFVVDAIVDTVAPITVSQDRPQIKTIEIQSAKLTSASAVQSVSGRLEVDTFGRLNGPLTLNLHLPDQLIDASARAGLMTNDVAQQFKQALKIASGGNSTMQLDAMAKDGVLSFGPFPLLRLPRVLYHRQ